MALQSSGAISLNDIHVEAGGSSGTQASMNDSDIRALIGSTASTTVSFSDYYGASSSAEFVGAVTRKENDESELDSASEAINLTGAGVQVGDFVVIAFTADTSDHTSMTIQGMSGTLVQSGDTLPASLLFYGFWASGNSNPFLSGSGGTNSTRMRAMSVVAAIFRNTNSSVLRLTTGTLGGNNITNEGNASGPPDPPANAAVSGSTSKLIVAIAMLDDDRITMTAPSGYTLAGAIATDNATSDGITGSATAIAYKFPTSETTENPGVFGPSSAIDSHDSYTLRV